MITGLFTLLVALFLGALFLCAGYKCLVIGFGLVVGVFASLFSKNDDKD